jgi:glyceraldehyde-3-phosphate dehydrogenase (NADP+)
LEIREKGDANATSEKRNQLTFKLIDDAVSKVQVINERRATQFELYFSSGLVSINKEMRVYHEEQFGPVVPILTFNDIQNH